MTQEKRTRARRVMRALDPVFTQKSVDETSDPLLKLLKLIFTRLGITSEEFGARHQDWWTNGGGKGAKSPVHTSLNNFRQAMTHKKTITWDAFVKIALRVVKLDLVDISISFRHPRTKEIITVRSSDNYATERKEYEKESEGSNEIV